VTITLEIPVEKYQHLQKMAQSLKTESLIFIEKPMSWGCYLCPLNGNRCETEKQRSAKSGASYSFAIFDCYGTLMRWLFWKE
jgi:hypothetical protein